MQESALFFTKLDVEQARAKREPVILRALRYLENGMKLAGLNYLNGEIHDEKQY